MCRPFDTMMPRLRRCLGASARSGQTMAALPPPGGVYRAAIPLEFVLHR
jgi:hypothetical protein